MEPPTAALTVEEMQDGVSTSPHLPYQAPSPGKQPFSLIAAVPGAAAGTYSPASALDMSSVGGQSLMDVG